MLRAVTLRSPLLALKPTKTVLPPSERASCAVMKTAPTNWTGKREASEPLVSRGRHTGPTVSACLKLRDPQTRIALRSHHPFLVDHTSSAHWNTGDRDHDGMYRPCIQVGA